MSKIDASNVTEYILSIFQKPDKIFETVKEPIAVFDNKGKIVRASKLFRKLAGMTEDDVTKGSANIYKCLNNDDNAGLTDAVERFLLHDSEKRIDNLVFPLLTKTEAMKAELAGYKAVLLFPLTYIREWMEYGGIMLIAEKA